MMHPVTATMTHPVIVAMMHPVAAATTHPVAERLAKDVRRRRRRLSQKVHKGRGCACDGGGNGCVDDVKTIRRCYVVRVRVKEGERLRVHNTWS